MDIKQIPLEVLEQELERRLSERKQEQETRAMQAGMAFGVDGYNDAMGYDMSAPGPCGHHCPSDCPTCRPRPLRCQVPSCDGYDLGDDDDCGACAAYRLVQKGQARLPTINRRGVLEATESYIVLKDKSLVCLSCGNNCCGECG